MTKDEFLKQRDYFNMVHGVTIRAIKAMSDADLDFRPKPGMRSPRELIFHIYAQERALAEAARDGRFTPEMANASNSEDPANATAVAALATVGDAAAYADGCHRTAEEILRSMSEDAIARPIDSPFGAYPSWRFLQFAHDEHWHHRGQLYTYLRLLGKQPPELYDFQ